MENKIRMQFKLQVHYFANQKKVLERNVLQIKPEDQRNSNKDDYKVAPLTHSSSTSKWEPFQLLLPQSELIPASPHAGYP